MPVVSIGVVHPVSHKLGHLAVVTAQRLGWPPSDRQAAPLLGPRCRFLLDCSPCSTGEPYVRVSKASRVRTRVIATPLAGIIAPHA